MGGIIKRCIDSEGNCDQNLTVKTDEVTPELYIVFCTGKTLDQMTPIMKNKA